MTSSHIRRLFVLLAAAVLAMGLYACGGTGKNTGAASPRDANTATDSTTEATQEETQERAETAGTGTDNGVRTSSDSAARAVLDFGHEADATDTRSIAALVRRYYIAATAENGSQACSLLYSVYAEAVPSDYGTSPPGPPYARGATCPAVMSLIFKHFHPQLTSRLPKLKVARVRLSGRQGLAVLSFGAIPERELHVVREGHIWKILGLIDVELPQ